jgi:hypothetical protein
MERNVLIDVNLGNRVGLVDSIVIVHGVDIEINMVAIETPALIYECKI